MTRTMTKKSVLQKTVERCRERGVTIPTFAQLKDPAKIPADIKKRLKGVGLNDVNPLNLFRITWKNDVKTGLFGGVNFLEIPRAITGIKARVVGLVGSRFPTGAHKVGAAFGCLAPRLVSGEFDPTSQKAVWPSTGNYCRGGAFDCAILSCTAVAILPKEMSRERFTWLKTIGAEIIATPGCESNVKEIYDKCWEIRKTRKDCVIFNQFEEFGNPVWHYHTTGPAVEEAFRSLAGKKGRLAGYVSSTGSAGTIAAGDYLRTVFPQVRVNAVEALQCPTMLMNGYGGHRIEGIGDKHIPWIHNVRNTDLVIAVDDGQCLALLRLFNEQPGHEFLIRRGVPADLVERLDLLGISSICNLVAAIKTAKYYEMDGRDVIFTCLTDSAEMYASRLAELNRDQNPYGPTDAGAHFSRYLEGAETDHLRELNYRDRKALHNFKYFTWVEQQGRSVDELRRLWDPDFWTETFSQAGAWDSLIEQFNQRTGLLES